MTVMVSFLFVIVVVLIVLVYFPANAYATPANVTGYSKYTGGTFSLLYPKTWTAGQGDLDIPGSETFVMGSKQPPAAIILIMISDPELITSMNMTQEDIESNLEQIFPRMVKGVVSAIQRGTLTELQSPDYDKYVVDGHRVGSVVYKATYGQIPEKDLLISTIVGKNIFALAYLAPEYAFDQSLPDFENVIKSIKFLQPLNVTNNVQN